MVCICKCDGGRRRRFQQYGARVAQELESQYVKKFRTRTVRFDVFRRNSGPFPYVVVGRAVVTVYWYSGPSGRY